MSDPHFMLRPEVTRFSHGVPTEVIGRCGGCEGKPIVTGHGATLAECGIDLTARFAEHAGATQ